MLGLGLHLITALRGLAEIAGMFLLAQGMLYVLAAGAHRQNFVYQLFCVITAPVISATRRITPKRIGDRHIPWLAFLLLFVLWIALAYVRQLFSAIQAGA